jgi:hypothetical protein
MHCSFTAITAIALSLVYPATAQETFNTPNRVYHNVVVTAVRQHPVPQDDDVAPPAPPPTPPGIEEDAEMRNGECVRFLGQKQCAPSEGEVAARLIASGPAELNIDDSVKPSAVGFVRDHWPFVIDFAPQPDTITVLKVRLYHRRILLLGLPIPIAYYEVAFRQVIDIGGEGGRRVAVLPDMDFSQSQDGAIGSDVRVARYDIRSYRLENGEPLRQNGRLVRAPVEIFGMGAGPNAVGSITINDIRFGPPQVRIPPQGQTPTSASYSFHLDRNYNLASAFVARCVNLVCNRDEQVVGRLVSPFGGQNIQGAWTVRPNAKSGDYAVTIRAWLDCGGTANPQAIKNCEDQAAWAFGRAKPVKLVP